MREFFAGALAAVLLVGCANQAFSVAKRKDTVEAYRAFLRDYPHADDAEPAHERLAQLELDDARSIHTIVAYKRFLDEFGDTSSANQARELLEGLRFNAASDASTAAAWRQFLIDHPDGAHADQAKAKVVEAERLEAIRLPDEDARRRFLAEHPDDPRAAELETKLDDDDFHRASVTGAAALFAYLTQHAGGAHRDDARALLWSRKVEGLIVSGRIAEAEAEAQSSPLAAHITDLPARLERASERRRWRVEPSARSALSTYYVRELPDLERSLEAPDPLDRWEAAEELGQLTDVRAIDVLLRAIRLGRNALIRERAFDSLRSVLALLPHDVADYEVAARLEDLREKGVDSGAAVQRAVLLDLSGKLELAATEYQKAFDPNNPDPLVLWRWTQIRSERHQPYSAAVVARQLAIWARSVAQESTLPETGALPLSTARQLCAAVVQARFASSTLVDISSAKGVEFPEDVSQFAREAREALKLAEAKLGDAELLLRTQDSHALRCNDARVSERIQAGIAERRRAMRAMASKHSRSTNALLAWNAERDPSADVRADAKALLATLARE